MVNCQKQSYQQVINSLSTGDKFNKGIRDNICII